MAWAGGFDRSFSAAEFKEYVATLKWDKWKPKGVCLHHTGSPSLAQWKATPVPGNPNPTMQQREAQRMKNLEHYYKNQQKWSAGPHLFIGERIWLGTPLTVQGVHAVSFNATHIGIEMAGNYDIEHLEGDVRTNTIAALKILHEALGISPDTLKFHRDDPKTTKTCPGKNIVKADIIAAVKGAMGTGAVAPKIEPQADEYVAKPGDTFWSLARKFAKAVADLIAWNGPALKAGQKVALKEPLKPANEFSHEGACALAREEGVVLQVYMDGNTPAVGMGHNDARLKVGDKITLEEAVALFKQDIKKFTAGVLKVLTKPTLQHELDAMILLAYNIGLGSFSRSSVVAHFNSGDKAKAADAFLLWHKASGKADVLLGRRQRERTLFLTSSYGKIDTVPVWTGDPKTTKPVKMALPK
jgi:GH24 family phage-related lysozyme (muramidase)